MIKSFVVPAAILGATLLAGPTGACYLETIPMNGFSAAHPGSVSMAVAMRRAVENGVMEPMSTEASARALYRAALLANRHIRQLETLS